MVLNIGGLKEKPKSTRIRYSPLTHESSSLSLLPPRLLASLISLTLRHLAGLIGHNGNSGKVRKKDKQVKDAAKSIATVRLSARSP